MLFSERVILLFFVLSALSATKMVVVLEAHCNMCPDVMITNNGNLGFSNS